MRNKGRGRGGGGETEGRDLSTYQQNQRIITPRAASDTVSSPPCAGYIQSQKPLHGEEGDG